MIDRAPRSRPHRPRSSAALAAALTWIATSVLPFVATASSSCRRDDAVTQRSGPPQRVVSLAPSCTETLIELGLADRIVGRSKFCPPLPAGMHAVELGGRVDANAESILALAPDLVLTVVTSDDRMLATLRRHGVDVRGEDPQSIEQMLASVTSLAELFGAPERGAKLVAALRARLAKVASNLSAARADGSAPRVPPRVYVEVDWPPFTVGRRSFVHEALVAAGGENVFGDEELAYFKTSPEAIVARKPEVVLLLHPLDRSLEDRREFAALGGSSGPVVVDLGDERDLLLRSSPQLVRGIELLAPRLAAAAKVAASRR